MGQEKINGTVIEQETGEPLPGVTVLISGTNKGTTTDFEGRFQLNVDLGAKIELSYLGFETQEIIVGEQKELSITMKSSQDDLDEIVVVGYGTQRRSNVVGSVATVDVKQANQVPTTNVSELLRGRAAGVQVNLADARPGGTSNIVIRGNVSVAGGNNPLIIVDGLPFDNLNDISPDDIQSLEVLKDAASTSIYGARASNGVILVTTKKAKADIQALITLVM